MTEQTPLQTTPDERRKAERRRTSLPRIVAALRVYAAEYLRVQAKPLHRLRREADLPSPLAWAALRGEGIIRLRFCRYFEAQGLSYESGEQLLAMWSRLGCNAGLIFDLLSRAGVFAALSTQFRLPEPSPELAWQLYCGMIDGIERSGQNELLKLLTDQFWQHHFINQFPAQVAVPVAQPLAALRQHLHKALQKHYGLPVELKEHFTTEVDEAVFRLRWRCCPPGQKKTVWIESEVWRGGRLKPLKQQAYRSTLSALDQSRGLVAKNR